MVENCFKIAAAGLANNPIPVAEEDLIIRSKKALEIQRLFAYSHKENYNIYIINSGVYLMSDCECLEKCPFFNDKMEKMPSLAHLLKRQYCQGDNSSCARYMVFKAKGRDAVPSTLYPNDKKQAEKLLII